MIEGNKPYDTLPKTTDIVTKRAPNQPHKVVALIYDGLCTFEFGIAAEIFGLPRPELGRKLYAFTSVALEDGILRASGGLAVRAEGNFEDFTSAQTLIIAGWRGKNADVPDVICEAVREAHERGVRIVTICSGIYVLAAAGVLSGKTVTTHWRYADHFAQTYPGVKVDADALYVADGNIISSAGSSAGIDACLHVVGADYGAKVANSVARRLVMHAHRQGDQSQYIERPMPQTGGAHRLAAILETVRGDLRQDHNVAMMASKAGMSARTFQRQFVALTGLSPMKWVIHERIRHAQTLLETTGLSIDTVSDEAGFANSEALRYHFRQKLGLSPVSYRKRFLQVAV